MSEVKDEKQCKACSKALSHTSIKAHWSLDTLEGKVVLAEHFYCVLCGTLRASIDLEQSDE